MHFNRGILNLGLQILNHLWNMGYAAEDIVKNIFKVCKNMDVEEVIKLKLIKVSNQKFL